MAENADERCFEPQGSIGPETVPKAGPSLEISKSQAAYLKFINNARKAVAIMMVVCGVAFIIFLKRYDYLCGTLRRDRGLWMWGTWVFGIGVAACLVAALAFIIEYVVRPVAPKPITLRSLFLRSLLTIITIAAICYSMIFAFGPAQGIGATIGTFLLLAALKKHNKRHYACAILAVIVLGLTLLGTQSAYQYARWHADEIVAAGCELMDNCPIKDYYTYNQHPEIDTAGILALFGQEIQPSDPRVPNVLRKLGALRIWVDEERVAVYVGSNKFDLSCIPNPGSSSRYTEFPTLPLRAILSGDFMGKGPPKSRIDSGAMFTRRYGFFQSRLRPVTDYPLSPIPYHCPDRQPLALALLGHCKAGGGRGLGTSNEVNCRPS